MIAVLTGLNPEVVARQPAPMFEALVEECDRAQWSVQTELVAWLVEIVGGGKVARPSWLERLGKRKLRGRELLDWMRERSGPG